MANEKVMAAEKHYGIADRAWQPIVGCDPSRPCAKRCWARKTTARIVECQKVEHPERAAFYRIALTPDGQQWSGEVVLDRQHLHDPLKWRDPAVVATGFHGDIGELSLSDLIDVISVIKACPRHDFMLLTKAPSNLLANLLICNVLPNVTIGCSVMYQSGEFGADQTLQPMRRLSELGWRTHVWHEPALSQVNWSGWQFIERLIYGGESGADPRRADIWWARADRNWAKANGIAFVCKQLGAHVTGHEQSVPEWVEKLNRKGDNWEVWPEDLRIRELPEVRRG